MAHELPQLVAEQLAVAVVLGSLDGVEAKTKQALLTLARAVDQLELRVVALAVAEPRPSPDPQARAGGRLTEQQIQQLRSDVTALQAAVADLTP